MWFQYDIKTGFSLFCKITLLADTTLLLLTAGLGLFCVMLLQILSVKKKIQQKLQTSLKNFNYFLLV
jgi:hypothetical protein